MHNECEWFCTVFERERDGVSEGLVQDRNSGGFYTPSSFNEMTMKVFWTIYLEYQGSGTIRSGHTLQMRIY